ncbi:MAG: hypothetical protein LBS81_04165 [Endomicrobium sp.]|nr:hypothetical protein [Endomicrobium sp.]
MQVSGDRPADGGSTAGPKRQIVRRGHAWQRVCGALAGALLGILGTIGALLGGLLGKNNINAVWKYQYQYYHCRNNDRNFVSKINLILYRLQILEGNQDKYNKMQERLFVLEAHQNRCTE